MIGISSRYCCESIVRCLSYSIWVASVVPKKGRAIAMLFFLLKMLNFIIGWQSVADWLLFTSIKYGNEAVNLCEMGINAI